jgi:hypothetical protein
MIQRASLKSLQSRGKSPWSILPRRSLSLTPTPAEVGCGQSEADSKKRPNPFLFVEAKDFLAAQGFTAPGVQDKLKNSHISHPRERGAR